MAHQKVKNNNYKTKRRTLNEIKLGQKTQEQVNIKLDKTLDAIKKKVIDEKQEENDKNIRDMKCGLFNGYWVANYSIIAYAYGHIRGE